MSIFEKTEQETFNMEDFGFEIAPDSRGKSTRIMNRSYILFTKNKNTHTYSNDLKLCLSSDDAHLVMDMFGEYATVGMNDKGWICIQAASRSGIRKVSLNGGHKGHYVISLAVFANKAHKIFGDFRRMYVDVSLYANANAILCKPNGDMDE